MYNYFYTIEIDLGSDLMQKEFGGPVSSMFKDIVGAEFSSQTFLSEKECVQSILSEIDKVCNGLVDKYDIEPLAIETYQNPMLVRGKTDLSSLTEEEKVFWKTNKLVLFAAFKSREDPNFLFRYVLYCYDDGLDLSKMSSSDFLKIESPSKFLN